MGCCVAGGLEFGAGLVRGHQHVPGVRLGGVPPNQACCWQHAWCLACVELCPLGREGSMIGGQIVPTHAMAKQLPLSRDVLWTRRFPVVCSICLSGLLRRLRLAMIGRHVSLLHAKKKSILHHNMVTKCDASMYNAECADLGCSTLERRAHVHRPYATADKRTDSIIIGSGQRTRAPRPCIILAV